MFRWLNHPGAAPRIFYLGAFILCLALWCPLQVSLLTFVIGAWGVSWWATRRFESSWPAASLGTLLLLIPLAPAFGRGALLSAVYLVFAVDRSTPLTVRGFAWCLPYIGLLLGTALVGLGPFEPKMLTSMVRSIDDLRSVAPALGFDGVFDALLVIAAAVTCDRIANSKGDERRVFTILGVVASLGTVAAVFQRFHMTGPFSFPNQVDFWEIQNRFSGMSSDPNAAAVLSFLLLPPMLWMAFDRRSGSAGFRVIHLIAVLSLALGAWLSGSRTWFIAVGISVLVSLMLLGRKRLVCVALLAVVAGVAAVTILDGAGFLRTEALAEWGVPSGVIRALNAASLFQIPETFYARSLFLRLAVEAALDNPVFGVGPGSFIRLVPTYQRLLGLPDSSWVDNANNFYAQVAAELGAAGVLLVGVTIWLFYCSARDARSSELTPAYWSSIVGLAGALWFGPHLQFEECALVAAIIAGLLLRTSSPCSARFLERPFVPLVTVMVVMVAVVAGGRRERGIFAPERDPQGVWWRWTTGEAKFDLVCLCQGRAEVEFAVMHAAPERPVQLVIETSDGGHRVEERFERPRIVKRSFPCRVDEVAGRLTGWTPILPVTLLVDPPWQPGSPDDHGGDRRLLGVRLRGSQPAYRWRECRNS
jgi:hypothetical protein